MFREIPSGGRSSSGRPSDAHSSRYASVRARTASDGTSAIIGIRSPAHQRAFDSVLVPYHSGGWGRCTGRDTMGASVSV
jgi:hypothetical protein